MKYKVICDNCGMELEIKKIDENIETLKSGIVKVQSFSCPKCDEKYIVSVMDEESDKLKEKLKNINSDFEKLKDMKDSNEKDEAARSLLKERNMYKRALTNHNNRLKQRYLKEMKQHGKR